MHDHNDAEVPFENAIRLSSRMPASQLLRTHGLGHRRLLRDDAVVDTIADFVQGSDSVPTELPPLPRPAPLY